MGVSDASTLTPWFAGSGSLSGRATSCLPVCTERELLAGAIGLVCRAPCCHYLHRMRNEVMKPVYLMAGGNWRDRKRPDPGLVAGLASVNRPTPSVAYIGAANGDDASFFRWFRSLAADAGAGEVSPIRLAGKDPDIPRARAVLAETDVVFVAGGDVEAGMRTLDRTGMSDILGNLHMRGRTFLGMSAGTIMLASQWIRWPDASDDTRVESFACLGIAPLLCDTHGESDEWTELRALLRLCKAGTIGYGIPSGCSLVTDPDGTLHALAGPVHRFERTADSFRRIPDLTP